MSCVWHSDQCQTELVGLSLPVWHHSPDEDCCLHLSFNLICLFAAVVLSQTLPDPIMNLLRQRRTSVRWTESEKLNWELNWIKHTAAFTGRPGLLHCRRQRQLNLLQAETCRAAAPHTFLDCVSSRNWTRTNALINILHRQEAWDMSERWEIWYRWMYVFLFKPSGQVVIYIRAWFSSTYTIVPSLHPFSLDQQLSPVPGVGVY